MVRVPWEQLSFVGKESDRTHGVAHKCFRLRLMPLQLNGQGQPFSDMRSCEVQGLLTGAGLFATGVPSSIFWGFISAILSSLSLRLAPHPYEQHEQGGGSMVDLPHISPYLL